MGLNSDFLVAQSVKCLPAMRETWVQSLGWEDPLEKETATHSSTLAWDSWMEETGSPWGHGVRHESNMTEQLHLFYFILPVVTKLIWAVLVGLTQVSGEPLQDLLERRFLSLF